jgi:hypothetical protein
MQVRNVKDAHSFRDRAIPLRRIHKDESLTAISERRERAHQHAAALPGGGPHSRPLSFHDHPEKKLVEVAGIEPASEGLQRVQPTCLSDSLVFAMSAFDSARTTHR